MNFINLDKKFLLPVVTFLIIIGFCFVGGNILIKKISERVIQEMKRPYAPGPYAPGFDPDKVDPRFFRQNQNSPQNQPQQFPNDPQPQFPPKYRVPMLDTQQWNEMWEQSRF